MAETGAREWWGGGLEGQVRPSRQGSKPQRARGEADGLVASGSGEAMRSEAVRVFVVCAQDEEPLGPARL